MASFYRNSHVINDTNGDITTIELQNRVLSLTGGTRPMVCGSTIIFNYSYKKKKKKKKKFVYFSRQR